MSQKDVGNKIPIYKLKTTREVMEFYDEWGDKDKYNKDMVDWDYSGPKETVNTFKKYAKNNPRLNDKESISFYMCTIRQQKADDLIFEILKRHSAEWWD
jgi:hypothetical protein